MKDSIARLVPACVAGVVLTLLVALPASAHASYKSSDPADGASVASSPSQVTAEYTEPPDAASYLKVFDPCGRQVDGGDTSQDQARKSMTVSMQGDAAGTYRVDWFVNSTVDNHPTRGSFTFTVQSGDPCPNQVEKEPRESEPKDRDTRDNEPVEENDPADETGGDDPAAVVGDGGSGDRRGSDGDASGDRRPQGRDPKPRSDPDEDVIQPGSVAVDAPEGSGLLTGIPLGGLLVALAMAAVIGAAGGLIYAGIMGYRR